METLDINVKSLIIKILWFFSPIFLIAAVLVLLGIRSGELLPIQSFINYELSHPNTTLFLKAFLPDHYRMKYYEILRRNPEILVVGSSRAMTFREEMFPGLDFYNGSRTVYSYEDLSDFTELLLPKITPKIIYLELDWYWLGSHPYSHELGMVPVTKDEVYNWRVVMYFFRNSTRTLISDPALVGRIIKRQPEAVSNKIPIGLMAFEGDGMRYDGSFQFGTLQKRRAQSSALVDFVQPSVLDQIRIGMGHFPFNNYLNIERLSILENFLLKAKERNIQIIGFSPPYSKEVYRELTTNPFHKDFFAESRREISNAFRNAQFSYFDFHDLRSLGLDDGYMLDGGHMSETAAAILLKNIISDEKLKSYLDDKINQKSTTPLEIIW